jgi:hypothetical protein
LKFFTYLIDSPSKKYFAHEYEYDGGDGDGGGGGGDDVDVDDDDDIILSSTVSCPCFM